MPVKKMVASALLIVWTTGCAAFGDPPERELLLELRKSMAESVRDSYVDALDNARGPDGRPLYIDAYKSEKIRLVDRMILSVDRVYPPEQPYEPATLPWEGGQ